MAIHDAEYLKERFSDLKTPIGSEFSDLIDSCINYTLSGVVGFYSLSAVNVAVLSSFSVLSGGNSNQWDSTYTTVNANSSVWGTGGSSVDVGVRSLTANWESVYTTVNSNSATTWNYQGSDIKALSSTWDSTYTNVNTNSAKWESVYTNVYTNSSTNVKTVATTSGLSAVTTIVVVSAIPSIQSVGTLYILI